MTHLRITFVGIALMSGLAVAPMAVDSRPVEVTQPPVGLTVKRKTIPTRRDHEETPSVRLCDIVGVTNRLPEGTKNGRPQFTAKDGPLRYDRYGVSISKKHQLGKITDIPLLSCETGLNLDGICRDLKPGNVLVIVHGFNVGHEECIRRAAQIANELGHQGPVFAFSWPSLCQLSKAAYFADRKTLDKSVPTFRRFLEDLTTRVPNRKIQILAHSLGGRLVVKTVNEIAADKQTTVRLSNIVFASPDVDAKRFNMEYAIPLSHVASRITVYHSKCDTLLFFSRNYNGNRSRLGRIGFDEKKHPTIEGVDFTVLGGAFAAHTYYRKHPALVKDIRSVLTGTMPYSQRQLMARAN